MSASSRRPPAAREPAPDVSDALAPVPASLLDQLTQLPDPRIDRTKRHALVDLVAITLLAVLCGADTFNEIAQFGRARERWLRTFLALPNGIPSHDTFARVFARLDRHALGRCLTEWAQAVAVLARGEAGEVVAIDGKTSRRAHRPGARALHTVSAWATQHQLVLGQVKTADHSNELTAIPELLELLDLKGCTVTIDAIGCQPDLTATLRTKRAHYVLPVKANQPWLHERVSQFFARRDAPAWQQVPRETTTTLTKGHGRIERRTYTIVPAARVLADRAGWTDLQSLGCVVAERRRSTDGTLLSQETRYFITSLAPEVEPFAHAVRSHWQIENCCHWTLDVVFQDDQSRARTDHGPANLATIRRWVLSLLRQDRTHPHGLKARRLQAAWDPEYLRKLLGFLTPGSETI